jgi:hypothetical protein
VHTESAGGDSATTFHGIDPETGTGNSPTVWVNDTTRDVIIQGFKAEPELQAECTAFELPGHAKGIPADEAVIRIPARMVSALRKACDAAEGADLR